MRQAHTTESILPSGGLPARTPYQFSRCIKTGSTGEPELCHSYEQVHHNSAFLAIGRAKLASRRLNVEPNIAPPLASSALLSAAVTARRFL